MSDREQSDLRAPARDRPWLMRTYSGHSSAKASNELYRSNLAKGQTGLSVAFDLPTQTGYDADHVLARGEVGKVGVPVCSIDDMRTLFDGIPLDEMNTSMTINATAAWLLALYIAVAEEQGADRADLKGTVQNDIIKEYLSRGTYVFGPAESLRLTGDVITFAVREVPSWNPINICSYHLQEVGATPVQEVAFAMATATAVLDEIKGRPGMDDDTFSRVFGRISFFVNAGIRFVDEIAKLRAMGQLWDELGRERYGVEDPRHRRFRYGVQVNSLGLTEAQPENNITRIVLEMLAVTLSKSARARAVQLPAWNEALGLPRPWDQQLALRMQQILAYETDLLEHEDVFDGSHVMEARTTVIADAAREEYRRVIDMGGSVEAVEYMKAELVRSNAERMRRVESGEQVVVGVNRFTESEPSPLMAGGDGGIMKVDPASEAEQVERLEAFRAERDAAAVDAALAELRRAVAEGDNVMPASIAAAKAGVTTGEWTEALREEWGTYRGPTGVTAAAAHSPAGDRAAALEAAREAVRRAEERVGGKVRLLVGKPGLDGHSSGAEQIAVRARDAGFEVIYEGIRLTPAQIVRAAVDEDVHLIGLSILSGSHGELIPEVLERLAAEDAADIPVVVGGIIPAEDAVALREAGVAAVYTPKDFEVSRLIEEMADLVGR
ncbi:protein meaA [Euzebya sp.]|uniref:protein meaA n=1 Tax=Euzebya sp. TaxID=1971409 RepID=UPI003518D027